MDYNDRANPDSFVTQPGKMANGNSNYSIPTREVSRNIRYRRSDNPSHQLTLSEKWTGKAQNGDQFLSKNSMANVQILFKIASSFSVYKQQKSMTAEEIRNITFEHSRQQRQFERAQGKKVGSRFFTS